MNYLELIDKLRRLPQPKIYKNSTEVCRIKGTPLNLWDVVTAALIARLNILLVGERGEGKTQLATEINDTYFGGRGTLIRAHPDLKIKDIYTALNLEKLASAKGDTHQALEIVASTKNPLKASLRNWAFFGNLNINSSNDAAFVILHRPLPVIRSFLPNDAFFSSKTTLLPSCADLIAAIIPAGPPPTTITLAMPIPL